jgi:hypothetical protein
MGYAHRFFSVNEVRETRFLILKIRWALYSCLTLRQIYRAFDKPAKLC